MPTLIAAPRTWAKCRTLFEFLQTPYQQQQQQQQQQQPQQQVCHMRLKGTVVQDWVTYLWWLPINAQAVYLDRSK